MINECFLSCGHVISGIIHSEVSQNRKSCTWPYHPLFSCVSTPCCALLLNKYAFCMCWSSIECLYNYNVNIVINDKRCGKRHSLLRNYPVEKKKKKNSKTYKVVMKIIP